MAGDGTGACRGRGLWSSGRRGGGSPGMAGEEWEVCHVETQRRKERGEGSPGEGSRGQGFSPGGCRQARLSLQIRLDLVFRGASPRQMHAAGAKRAPSLSSAGEAARSGASPYRARVRTDPLGRSPSPGAWRDAKVGAPERPAKRRAWGALRRLSGSSTGPAVSPASALVECARRLEAHDPQAAPAVPREAQAAHGCTHDPASPSPPQGSASPEVSLDCLPADILLKILCLLPRASWPSARRVCRAWRDATGSGDMVRQRRALGVAEAWVFQVEWMFPRGRASLALLWALDPAVHRWYALGCLPPMHGVSHTSHVCEFGRYIVFLGGNARRGGAGMTPGACVWRYNPMTGQVRRLPDMLQARVGCCAAAVGGRLLVAGGTGDNDVALRGAEAFDPEQRRWVRLPDLKVARRHCVGFQLGGRFWVLSLGAPSESEGRSAEVYDPASQRWTLIPNMLPQGLGGRLSTRVALVGGRLVLTSHVSACQHAVMAYDESQNVWHTLGHLPVSGFRGYGIVGLPSAQGGEASLLVEGGIESGAEDLACNHHVLQGSPYVSQFAPWASSGKQWRPNCTVKEGTGTARRCQHCIVSSL